MARNRTLEYLEQAQRQLPGGMPARTVPGYGGQINYGALPPRQPYGGLDLPPELFGPMKPPATQPATQPMSFAPGYMGETQRFLAANAMGAAPQSPRQPQTGFLGALQRGADVLGAVAAQPGQFFQNYGDVVTEGLNNVAPPAPYSGLDYRVNYEGMGVSPDYTPPTPADFGIPVFGEQSAPPPVAPELPPTPAPPLPGRQSFLPVNQPPPPTSLSAPRRPMPTMPLPAGQRPNFNLDATLPPALAAQPRQAATPAAPPVQPVAPAPAAPAPGGFDWEASREYAERDADRLRENVINWGGGSGQKRPSADTMRAQAADAMKAGGRSAARDVIDAYSGFIGGVARRSGESDEEFRARGAAVRAQNMVPPNITGGQIVQTAREQRAAGYDPRVSAAAELTRSQAGLVGEQAGDIADTRGARVGELRARAERMMAEAEHFKAQAQSLSALNPVRAEEMLANARRANAEAKQAMAMASWIEQGAAGTQRGDYGPPGATYAPSPRATDTSRPAMAYIKIASEYAQDAENIRSQLTALRSTGGDPNAIAELEAALRFAENEAVLARQMAARTLTPSGVASPGGAAGPVGNPTAQAAQRVAALMRQGVPREEAVARVRQETGQEQR